MSKVNATLGRISIKNLSSKSQTDAELVGKAPCGQEIKKSKLYAIKKRERLTGRSIKSQEVGPLRTRPKSQSYKSLSTVEV